MTVRAYLQVWFKHKFNEWCPCSVEVHQTLFQLSIMKGLPAVLLQLDLFDLGTLLVRLLVDSRSKYLVKKNTCSLYYQHYNYVLLQNSGITSKLITPSLAKGALCCVI